MKKRIYLSVTTVLAVSLLGLWAYGEVAYPHSNPPQRHTQAVLPPESQAILRRACYDCHSNETRYPWYTHLPVASIIMGEHVREGRDSLNFSLWDQMSPERRHKKMLASLSLIQRGRMPPASYTLLHPEAKLSPQQVVTLTQDASSVYNITASEISKRSRHEMAENEDGEGSEGSESE